MLLSTRKAGKVPNAITCDPKFDCAEYGVLGPAAPKTPDSYILQWELLHLVNASFRSIAVFGPGLKNYLVILRN